ncbi:TonB-dependent receptor [Dysgonomonas sp. BGC7]|uniref:SusC/RagA family TonB-linked outer membrane protein n=1 Tax=Dysgonomonas sp. BGC7 TaxID=1658008 RepID=UPI00067FF285|nr:TonB-dependent receptor [Dysgonomonas sp. BGC7]MBD8387142.1 TonB-dependent receptor [Dysgonomonas sp. BGC7]
MKKIKKQIFASSQICFIAISSLLAVGSPLIANASDNIKDVKEVQQSKTTVKGVVLDKSNNDPLIGVTVVVKGTQVATMTDIDGKFSINMPYAEASLVFSYIGFQPVEVTPAGKKELAVLMDEDSKALQEVVVVGYTKQRKETMIGSIATITTKDLKQSPTANINNALAGRLPGLIANQYSGGEPGVDRSELFIRGKSTYGDQGAIVIVDGIERDMSYLAPEEIETFTILKDASATAAYGIRGANGVIVITTKRGKAAEKASVNFKASLGFNNPVKFPEYLGSADYAMLYNEARANDAKMTGSSLDDVKLFSQDAIDKFRRAKGDNSDGLGYNWDYYDFAFQTGVQEDVSLSIRGGSDRARYYVLANYFSQGGNYKYTDVTDFDTQAKFKRYNFRSNIDIDITKFLTARLDLGARITDRNAPGTTAGRLMTIAATQPPHLPILVEENNHPLNEEYISQNPYGMLYGDNLYRFNMLGELSRTGYLNEKNTYLNGSFSMTLDMAFLLKGLKADFNFSYDASEGRWLNRKLDTYKDGYREYPQYATFMPMEGSDVYMNPGYYSGSYKTGNKYSIDQTIGNGLTHNASDSRTYIQARLDYNNTFKDVHEFTGMLLANRSNRSVNNELAYRYQGITGRLAYYYDKKYLAEFNFGYNGSENFAPGKRYGFFPAGSLGWVISRESFMENASSWLDMLKIRTSFGLVGSDNVSSRFPYLSFYGGGSGYSFGEDFGTGLGGTAEGNLANANLTWEKSRKFNLGLDIGTFNQRLNLTVDFFHEYRYDIITDMSGDGIMGFPTVVGKNAPLANIGEVSNRGIDLEISWNDKIGKDIRYYIKPNLTFARNKLEYKAEVARKNEWRRETGRRLYENYVYVFDHFVADQAEADRLNAINYQPWGKLIPGDAVYKDLDRDGVVTDEDRTALGNPRSPELMFGIPLGIQYKNFDFSVLFQGAARTSILLNGPAVYDFPQFDQDKIGKVKRMHLDRWTPETASTAKYPALHYGTHDNNKNGQSSLFLYDAKYLRLKNIEVGYNIPQKILKKYSLQQVRIYAQALNLITWDGLDDVDIDPETKSGDGASWYPIQKVFNFGIDITF